MTHLLDRPVWNALTTRHAHLAVGTDDAKRYDTKVSIFAAPKAETPDGFAALADVLPEREAAIVLADSPVDLPSDERPWAQREMVQLICEDLPETPNGSEIVRLGEVDALEMRALALLTKPGPFETRTHEMGAYWGVRIDGRLAAMAGERMQQPGFTEVSAVCTHPDFQGRGLGRVLSAWDANQIAARGETPYLHAWADNTVALRLYKSLGFVHRRSFIVHFRAAADD